MLDWLLNFYKRNKCTFTVLEEVSTFINKTLDADVLPSSKYQILKHLKNNITPTFHVTCEVCGEYGFKFSPRKELKYFECFSCSMTSKYSPKNIFFATFPLKEIIQKLIDNNQIAFNWFCRKSSFPMNDVGNGTIHQNIVKKLGQKFISLTLNTDGVRLFKATRHSLWPFLFSLNNLLPSERFKQDNIIVAGLHHKHNLNIQTLTDIIVSEINSINKEGGIFYRGESVPLICSQGTFDLPARSKVLNFTQFNGFCSCIYCWILGQHYNGSMKFSNR